VKDHPWANEAGGLSGKPVFEKSNHVLAAFVSAFSGKIPIIGVGGVSSKADAEAKFKAGADLVQIYTSFVYQGPALVRELVS
jgi:dihydroorotate dehydrogenase